MAATPRVVRLPSEIAQLWKEKMEQTSLQGMAVECALAIELQMAEVQLAEMRAAAAAASVPSPPLAAEEAVGDEDSIEASDGDVADSVGDGGGSSSSGRAAADELRRLHAALVERTAAHDTQLAFAAERAREVRVPSGSAPPLPSSTPSSIHTPPPHSNRAASAH